MNMAKIKNITTEDMIDKLQQLKGKTKLKFYKTISNDYIEMKNKTYQSQQDPFSGNAQCISKIYHEILLLMKILQAKPQIKNMNINYYDLYFTVIKVRDENKDIENQNENDYINFSDIITLNHNISITPRETILR